MDGGRAGAPPAPGAGEVHVASDARLASALQRLEYEDEAEARRMGPAWAAVQEGKAWWEGEGEEIGRMRDRVSAEGGGRAPVGRSAAEGVVASGTSGGRGFPSTNPPRRRDLRLEALPGGDEEALASTSVPGGANPSHRFGGRHGDALVAAGGGSVEARIEEQRRMLDACRVRVWPSSEAWVPASLPAAGVPSGGARRGNGETVDWGVAPPQASLKRARTQEDFEATSMAIRRKLNVGGCVGIPRAGALAARPAEAPPPDDLSRAAERARLERLLRDFGLAEREVAGDGNCLFRAVADQLFRDGGEAHAWVRALAADQLRLHRDAYEGFVALPPGEDAFGLVGGGGDAWDAYCARVARNGTWGDHVCIQALADALGAQFNILSSFAAGSYIEVPPGPASGNPRAVKDRHLFLSFHAEVHYGSVWPRGDEPNSGPAFF